MEEAVPQVEQRLHLVETVNAPEDVPRPYKKINSLLREDKTYGSMKAGGGKEIIKFSGIKERLPEIIGPINEEGMLQGEIIRIGGKDKTKHIQLLACNGEEYNLTTVRETAIEMERYLFCNVRVTGVGTWTRDEDMRWKLDKFIVSEFEPIEDKSLIEIVSELRDATQKSGWAKMADPLGALRIMRK
ncbi:MAG: hypothetical protein LBS40_06905 [Burkholderiales bacterium]|nr:hypothetical protein [Burkholderiales bacterium]